MLKKIIKKLQNSQNSELAIVSLDSGCTASIKSFPGLIYYTDKPSSKTYLKAYYGSDVRNGEDDYICDIELWYNLPKSKIWATNYLGREMLSNSPTGFGGVLSTRSVSGNRMSVIIGGTRAIAYGQSRNTLYNTIVIWE